MILKMKIKLIMITKLQSFLINFPLTPDPETQTETVQHHSPTKMSLQHPPFPMSVRTCSLY